MGQLFSWGVNFRGRTPYTCVLKDAIKYCAQCLHFNNFLALSMPPKRDISMHNLPWLPGTDYTIYRNE